MPSDNEFTRILQWPGYRVYRHAIDEKNKILELWVRRKRGNRKLECSGCGRKFQQAYDANERAVRDLPWSSFTTTVPGTLILTAWLPPRRSAAEMRPWPFPMMGERKTSLRAPAPALDDTLCYK